MYRNRNCIQYKWHPYIMGLGVVFSWHRVQFLYGTVELLPIRTLLFAFFDLPILLDLCSTTISYELIRMCTTESAILEANWKWYEFFFWFSLILIQLQPAYYTGKQSVSRQFRGEFSDHRTENMRLFFSCLHHCEQSILLQQKNHALVFGNISVCFAT